MSQEHDSDELSRAAVEFVKSNKKQLFEDLVKGKNYSGTENPVAIFMAGTPGAGKTEVAESLLTLFNPEPIRIDADEFRKCIPGYTGDNSHIVQSAATLAVDKVLDQVYDKKYPFILDATFAVGKATVNLKRAVRRGYVSQIYFIYQDPLDAWSFTKTRQLKEGRYVPKEAFIKAYFESRKNVKQVKDEFVDKVLLTLIVKNYKTGERIVYDNVTNIEKHLPKAYTEDELRKILDD